MITSPETRDLARRLLLYEADAGNTSGPANGTVLLVYDKLRGKLCQLAGVAGFHSLASRALTLARSEVPSLMDVRVAADGKLEGMNALEHGISVEDRLHEGGVVLISRLLGLLLIFLGEALTMNLVRDMWPDAAFDHCSSENGRNA